MPGPHASRPYRVEVPLRWSDMDAYGHVEQRAVPAPPRGRPRHRVPGVVPDRPTLLDEGIVVSRHAIEYRAPLTYRPEPVEVDMWVTRVHGAGFDLGYVVRDPDAVGEREYAVAETGLVLYDFATSSPRRLSAEARGQLAAHSGDAVTFRWSGR